MAFNIEFTGEQVLGSEPGNTGLYGRIVLGDYKETFVSFIGYWTPSDYRQHWRAGVERLVKGRRSSCLLTDVRDPTRNDVLMWWLLYPEGGSVAVQNALVLLRDLSEPFISSDPFRFVPPHRTSTEEGENIPEWVVPIEDFRTFLTNVSNTD